MADLTPTNEMKELAQKGLDLKEEHDSDAATDKGMSMARKIVDQTELSVDELKDMYPSFRVTKSIKMPRTLVTMTTPVTDTFPGCCGVVILDMSGLLVSATFSKTITSTQTS